MCIGNVDGDEFTPGQPSLDADLSSLVTGSFSGFPFCYGGGTDPPPLAVDNICGVDDGGLFTTAGCPSNAWMNDERRRKFFKDIN